MWNATNIYLLHLSIYVGVVECNSKRSYTKFTISPLEKNFKDWRIHSGIKLKNLNRLKYSLFNVLFCNTT